MSRRKILHRGFTDQLYFKNLTFAWVYTILCLVLTIFGSYIGIEDYSFVSIVCPLVWAELTVHTGFIIHKAKCENLSKYTSEGVVDNANMNINMDI